jgi:hypothetical protein
MFTITADAIRPHVNDAADSKNGARHSRNERNAD